MKILNLTQHAPTTEQVAAGVIEPRPDVKVVIVEALTFDDLPSREEIDRRAEYLAEVAARYDLNDTDDGIGEEFPSAAMIGGALWLMSALEAALLDRGLAPLYAFSRRESVEKTLPDGSVQKVNVFRHVGFVKGGSE